MQAYVALFTRAWIEIPSQYYTIQSIWVALFTRAWIEIQSEMEALDAVPCRPLYEGVDWNPKSILYNTKYLSRPLYEGVDWNTVRNGSPRCCAVSPSLRGRGLKSQVNIIQYKVFEVALFTRAWIEIHVWHSACMSDCVALFTRAWIEISLCNGGRSRRWSPSLRGRGLKLPLPITVSFHPLSPSLRGRGLKLKFRKIHNDIASRPLYEGVDWNFDCLTFWTSCFCRPLYEGVDWNRWYDFFKERLQSSPSLRGRGLKYHNRRERSNRQ